MKFKKYDSDIKRQKFNDLFFTYKYYLLEECLENTRATNFDSDEFKQEFYDQIEEIIVGIKSAEGY
jgi:hypothetical protein